MRITFLIFSLLTLYLQACKNAKDHETNLIRMPGEFEPQSAVWLMYPQTDHVSEMSNLEVTKSIIKELLPTVAVRLVVPNDSLLAIAQQQFPGESFEQGRLELLKIPYNEFWARDMGPSFIVKNGQLAIADFQFNTWGYYDTLAAYSQKDEKLDETAASLLKIPVLSTSLVSEGGGHESNGKGTLLLVESVETGRNPGMSKAQIEEAYTRTLGVKHFIWFKQGVHEDDHTHLGPIKAPGGIEAYTVLTTNGHVDEFARFANARTILLAKVDSADLAKDPIARENHRRLEENFAILKNAVDQDGQPFRIVRMPMPPSILWKMQPDDPVYQVISEMEFPPEHVFPKGKEINVVAATSYLNFLVSNGIVLGQKYWKKGLVPDIQERDEEARRILQQVFPGRKIVMLDALSVNWGGGGIHCITMHEPAVNN